MSLTKFSPLTCLAQDFCLISTPLLGSYDVPETRPYQINPICPIGADVKKNHGVSGARHPLPGSGLFANTGRVAAIAV